MGGISPTVPTVSAVVIPALDVESQPWHQEHTVGEEVEDEREGIGAGTAVLVLILLGLGGSIIGTIYALLYPVNDADIAPGVYITKAPVMILAVVSGVCVFAAAVVVASFLTCGCCCLGRYELKTRVNAWAKATLVTLCLVLALQITGRLFFVKSTTGLVMYCAIESVLLILALVFARPFSRGGLR